MGTISERTLGRRTVFFMKNEALVGRIPKGRIRVLASVLGVASAGQMTTGARTKDEGNERYRAMGEILDAWCTREALSGIDASSLSAALEQARLNYHAQTVRTMSASEASLVRVPNGTGTPFKRESTPMVPPANGYLTDPPVARSRRRQLPDQGATAAQSSASTPAAPDERSDGGTEDEEEEDEEDDDDEEEGIVGDGDLGAVMANSKTAPTVVAATVSAGSSSFGGESVESKEEEDEAKKPPQPPQKVHTTKKKRKLVYSYDGRVARGSNTLKSDLKDKVKQPSSSSSRLLPRDDDLLLSDDESGNATTAKAVVKASRRSVALKKSKSPAKKMLPVEEGGLSSRHNYEDNNRPRRDREEAAQFQHLLDDDGLFGDVMIERRAASISPKKDRRAAKLTKAPTKSKLNHEKEPRHKKLFDDFLLSGEDSSGGGEDRTNEEMITKGSPKKRNAQAHDRRPHRPLIRTNGRLKTNDPNPQDEARNRTGVLGSPAKSPAKDKKNHLEVRKTKMKTRSDDNITRSLTKGSRNSSNQADHNLVQPEKENLLFPDDRSNLSPKKKKRNVLKVRSNDDLARKNDESKDAADRLKQSVGDKATKKSQMSLRRRALSNSPTRKMLSKNRRAESEEETYDSDHMHPEDKLSNLRPANGRRSLSRPIRRRARPIASGQVIEEGDDRSEVISSAASKTKAKQKRGGAKGEEQPGSSRRSTASRDKKSRYYFSKYGTWRELQRISQANLKKVPSIEDNLDKDVRHVVDRLEYVAEAEKTSYADAIFKRIRFDDKYLDSLCTHNPEYVPLAAAAFSSFGTDLVVSTRTQLLSWAALERLRRFYWMHDDEEVDLPEAEDILSSKDSSEFFKSLCKLCYHVFLNDQLTVTGMAESDQRNRRRKAMLGFRQHGGVRLSRARMESLGLVRLKDRGLFSSEMGNFVDVHFARDSLLVCFLASVHVHTAEEDVSNFSKDKMVALLPFLCGLSSGEKSSKGQKVVNMIVDSLTGVPPPKDPGYYLRSLEKLWLESQQPFLDGVFEARMKDVFVYPQPGDKQIVLALKPLHLHEVIPLAYYLDHMNLRLLKLEGLMLQECSLTDESLRILGKNLFKVSKIQITGNYFTAKGIQDVVKHIRDRGGDRDNQVLVRSLDLSDSNIDDNALEKLLPLLPYLEELFLADNFFTWYGIRKMTQPQKKTRKLKKLDVSRCRLNEHSFHELIPLILRTEHVILEGNEITPLELKILGRQVRESGDKVLRLDTLVLNNCQLDDECLNEVAKFAWRVPNLHLQGGVFTPTSMRTLTKHLRRSDADNHSSRIVSINLKGCKLDSESLSELAEAVPRLQSLTISYNNFSGPEGVKTLASCLEECNASERKTTFVDLRHCRLTEGSKKLLSELSKKDKIEFKLW